MSSSLSRYELVVESLTRAGRGVELRTLAEGMLNRMLRQWASEYKYPVLRKVSTGFTLPAGSQFLSLPSDFGAGMDSLRIGYGAEKKRGIYEVQADEFFVKYGVDSTNLGQPSEYMVDEQSNRIIFSSVADKEYSIDLIYFYLPADIAVENQDGDSSKVWMKDDELVIQGLIEKVYQYNQDIREEKQHMLVEQMKAGYRRGSVPPGGGNTRVMLSRKRFKTRRF